jgi:type I restriction enzyme S subunit
MNNYKRLGDYIQLVDKRNKELAVTNLLGINITKNLMPSVANQTGLDLSKYKVVSIGEFATNLMHVNRDKCKPFFTQIFKRCAQVIQVFFVDD